MHYVGEPSEIFHEWHQNRPNVAGVSQNELSCRRPERVVQNNHVIENQAVAQLITRPKASDESFDILHS